MQLTDQEQGELPARTHPPNEMENQGFMRADDTFGIPGQAHEEAPSGPSFGDRLRASRERHGMSVQDCAQTLRLPIRLLEKLEADDYEGIDYSVYLKGYLKKYAAHVRLEESHVEDQLESLQTRQPVLVAPPSAPAWRRGFHRYSSAATYIVLTAVIVVPLVWLGLNGVLKRDIARLAPLNATPVSAQSTELADASGTQVADPPPAPAPTAAKPHVSTQAAPGDDQKPLMASIAPFSAMESDTKAPADTKAGIQKAAAASKLEQGSPAPAAKTHLTVSLQQPSWVEITNAAGKRLEYALLPAGTQRAYDSTQTLEVRIGNARGASVQVDGKALALDRFRRANVAHFDVENDGHVQPDNS